ncbi:MAG: DegT/DnrJ/EryC1/StrS family aminotransferase [Chloroflexota bacterium]
MQAPNTPGGSIPVAKPDIREEDIAAVASVLRSGHLAQGSITAEFEQRFAQYVGVRHAVAVSSGTAALHLALLARGIGPGDEVITTPFTFTATANAILFTGAKPVFVDIDSFTFNMDANLIEDAITSRTRALLPVHLYGQPCDMEAIPDIAERNGLAVIEDACQAHGAEWDGRRVGSFGTGCFSFYPTKNMTTGEGGIVTTNDAGIAEHVRVLRSHGQTGRYLSARLGFNYRMTDIGAALGLCQLERLEEYTGARIRNARLLTEGLARVPGLLTPQGTLRARHVFHQYTVRVIPGFPVSREKLQIHLASRGVGSAVHYPRPLHKQPYYSIPGYERLRLPIAEQTAGEVLSIPVHPGLSRSDVRHIVATLSRLEEFGG